MPNANKSAARGLGRGFDALLPQNFDASLLMSEDDRIQKVKIADITANEAQPRRHFDSEALKQLAESIKRYGVLQPLIATPAVVPGTYTIIAGERRWRAAKLAGLKTVPVIVRSSEELEQLEISLIENVQRVDLSPLEQAASIERLHQQFNLSYELIAQRLGKGTSTVTNIVRLLNLPAAARQALETATITEGHARAILALRDHPESQAELLKLIIRRGWSVRQAEGFVTTHKAGIHDTQAAQRHMRAETPETKQLGKRLGSAVSIRRMAHGGKLEIGFRSDDELTRLLKDLLK